jgi:hypothetical protein
MSMNNGEMDRLFAHFREMEAKEREAQVNALPTVSLSEKHVRNCDLLLNRAKLLSKLQHWGVVAELGVDHGDFSEEILRECQPLQLHLVDVWDTDRYNSGLFESTKARFSNEIARGQVHIHRKDSIAAADDFPENHFDWVYVDTTHSYETTWRELRKYAPKVKKGGIIAGHDYSMGNWITSFRYGVIEAVHEFCVEQDWEFVFLTMDPVERQSFAIRRIL